MVKSVADQSCTKGAVFDIDAAVFCSLGPDQSPGCPLTSSDSCYWRGLPVTLSRDIYSLMTDTVYAAFVLSMFLLIALVFLHNSRNQDAKILGAAGYENAFVVAVVPDFFLTIVIHCDVLQRRQNQLPSVLAIFGRGDRCVCH